MSGTTPQLAGMNAQPARSSTNGSIIRLSIRSKILLMMLVTSLLSLGTITYLAYQSGKDALTQAALDHLVSIRAAKKQQVEYYFRSLIDRFRIVSEAPVVTKALEELSAGYSQLGKKIEPERLKELEKFYSEKFLPELAKNTDDTYTLADVLPSRPAGKEVQALFIAENPSPIGDKSRLLRHKVENPYTDAHARYHPWFLSLTNRLSFYDLLLVDEHGDVVYSVNKEIEIGGRVTEGVLAGTNMGRLVRLIMETRHRGDVRIVDFALHVPSLNSPSGFIAAPLFKGNVFVGTLVAQISISELGNFMNDGGKWRQQGLGETGAVYLVGPDRLMRSDHRMIIETRDKFLAEVTKAGIMKPQLVERMKRQNSTVLYYPISKAVADPPLSGTSGSEIRTTQLGAGALFSFAPLDLPGLNWAIVARIDQREVFASQTDFTRKVIIAACTLALFGTLAALWLAGLFLRPVTALLKGIERLKNGERDVVVESKSGDEFSELVDAFNGMATTIRERDDVIEGKTRAYEQLLKRIFPETVAYRLKQGEATIVESFPQVTVIYAIIDGFSPIAESRTGDAAVKLLNEIVDRLDDVAEERGVEKVKTIGDHYLAVSGLSVARLDNASRALGFARQAWLEIMRVNQSNGTDLGLRVGIATGSAQAGLVGSRRFVFDIWGAAVSAARRIVYEADLNSVRLNAQAYALLTDTNGIGEELVITTKSLGALTTYQLRFSAKTDGGAPEPELATASAGSHASA